MHGALFRRSRIEHAVQLQVGRSIRYNIVRTDKQIVAAADAVAADETAIRMCHSLTHPLSLSLSQFREIDRCPCRSTDGVETAGGRTDDVSTIKREIINTHVVQVAVASRQRPTLSSFKHCSDRSKEACGPRRPRRQIIVFVSYADRVTYECASRQHHAPRFCLSSTRLLQVTTACRQRQRQQRSGGHT